jgi:hypothetical protein
LTSKSKTKAAPVVPAEPVALLLLQPIGLLGSGRVVVCDADTAAQLTGDGRARPATAQDLAIAGGETYPLTLTQKD